MVLVCIILFGYNYFDLKIEHFDNIFCYLITSQETGWEEHLRNDLFFYLE